MRKIHLYGPATDKRGRYRDAGEDLIVGAADNDDADITTETADDLLARGIAVTLTEAREDAALPDPLDHDRDGKRGGAAKPVVTPVAKDA